VVAAGVYGQSCPHLPVAGQSWRTQEPGCTLRRCLRSACPHLPFAGQSWRSQKPGCTRHRPPYPHHSPTHRCRLAVCIGDAVASGSSVGVGKGCAATDGGGLGVGVGHGQQLAACRVRGRRGGTWSAAAVQPWRYMHKSMQACLSSQACRGQQRSPFRGPSSANATPANSTRQARRQAGRERRMVAGRVGERVKRGRKGLLRGAWPGGVQQVREW
jgi:hypothetical protein